jgi:hypothetical protein
MTMSKPGLSILSMLIGLAAGILVGYLIFTHSAPEPPAPDAQHFYYRLNDSMIARHTISVSESLLGHDVDTVAIELR